MGRGRVLVAIQDEAAGRTDRRAHAQGPLERCPTAGTALRRYAGGTAATRLPAHAALEASRDRQRQAETGRDRQRQAVAPPSVLKWCVEAGCARGCVGCRAAGAVRRRLCRLAGTI